MTRVLRYPRSFACFCVLTILCAALRDICLSASQYGFAQVLLYITLLLLPVCVALLSCRFVVDAQGVGVGFLLRMRQTSWNDIASFGILYCNTRRRYLYGMYRGHTDFLNLLHHAPMCGQWGFVVPLGKELLQAVCRHCPFGMDLSPIPPQTRPRGMRAQWRRVALQALTHLPCAAAAAASGALMLLRAAKLTDSVAVFALTLGALALFALAGALLSRLKNAALTCPCFSEKGICTGRGMYLDWEDVRFGYVHRIAQMSGLYLLSRPHYEVQRRIAPPIVCLSMPDTSTLLLAYLTYCPHAEKGVAQ